MTGYLGPAFGAGLRPYIHQTYIRTTQGERTYIIEDLDLTCRIAVFEGLQKVSHTSQAKTAGEIDKNEGQRIETHISLHNDIVSCFSIPIYV